MSKKSMLFVGLDLRDRYSQVFILDAQGDLLEDSRLPTSRAALERKFVSLPSCRIALEVGAHSRWASQLLQDLGHEVVVANARKLSILLHHFWKNGEVYEPFYRSAKPVGTVPTVA
jgi:transposase